MQSVKANSHLFIAGGKLRHDLESREYSIQGGSIAIVSPETFPIINEVVLGGRCIKDIDQGDARAFKRTDSGYVICNQTLSVNTGKNKADLFNFFAINKVDDRFNKAEYLASLTRNGTGLTISGRVVTDAWTDKATGQAKSKTQIQMYDMTLAPKPKAGTIQPSTELPANTPVQSLWGGQTQPDTTEPAAEAVMPESPHQAAIATPQGQVLDSQQPAAVGSINSSNDGWDDNDAPF
jgi:single-stranded DNA-binding protein